MVLCYNQGNKSWIEGLNGMVAFTGKRLYFGFTVQFTVQFLTFLNFNFKE